MKAAFPTQKCPECQGSGEVFDQVRLGEDLRAIREKAEVSVRKVAAIMGFSASYVSDLELGRRKWSEELIRKYKTAVTKLCKQ